MMDENRMVEIAQGMIAIQRICVEYDLVMEACESGGFSWFEVWAQGVDDIVSLVDTVATTFEGDI